MMTETNTKYIVQTGFISPIDDLFHVYEEKQYNSESEAVVEVNRINRFSKQLTKYFRFRARLL